MALSLFRGIRILKERIWGVMTIMDLATALPGFSKCRYNATALKNRIDDEEKPEIGLPACQKPDDERGKQNTCDFCCKKFTAKKNLLKHLRNVHRKFKEAEQMVVKKIKCPAKGCRFICRMMKDLRCHIEESHKIKLLKDSLQFQNDKVFQKWKKEEETNTVSWFVTGRKKTTLTDGSKKQIFYCHRTGQYNPKSYGKYRIRSVGSCKIGMTCPASMEVTEFPDGHLTVIYYKTHLGHVQDVVYLKLSKEERMEIADKIEQGFSFDAILEDVKESTNSKENKKKRIHLLSKKDLYRIMRTENEKKTKIKKNDVQPSEIRDPGIRGNDNPLSGESLKSEKNDDSSHHNFTIYPASSYIPSRDQCNVEGNILTQKESDLNIPQTSGEGVASQIVILSPDLDYSSVAKIILLSTGEAPPQGTLTHIPAEGFISKKLEETPQGIKKKSYEENNTSNRPNLSLQIKEKLDKISEFMPRAEFLTPKQFNRICTKLEGVLEIFHAAKRKGRTKGGTKRKMVMSKPENEVVVQCKTDHHLLTQPVYESSLLYAVYN